MKVLSREFWGTVLIWLGTLIFLGVLYNSIRPYFPQQPPYPSLRQIPHLLKNYFSSRPTAVKKKPRRAQAPPRRGAPALPPGRGDLLTSNIHQTEGHYNLWVWAVKPEYKTGDTVKVQIAHAAGGEKGGFQIVAYADTDGDDKPDREIARSDFLTARKPGDWSSFEFKTPQKRIFIGNTWPVGSNTWLFRGSGLWPLKDCPFEGRFYHRISPSHAVSAGPDFTNLKVSFSD